MMNIVIVSGQYGVDILPVFDNLVNKYSGCKPMYFPERLEKYYHPSFRYQAFKKQFIEFKESNTNVVVGTYCNYIFNAARLVKHRYPKQVNLILYQLDNNGNNNMCEINPSGRVPICVDEVFNTFDVSLDELLDLV